MKGILFNPNNDNWVVKFKNKLNSWTEIPIVNFDSYNYKNGQEIEFEIISNEDETKIGVKILTPTEPFSHAGISKLGTGPGVKRQKEINYECTLGVGTGDSNLFVHGSYEAIKKVQNMIFELEQLKDNFDDVLDTAIQIVGDDKITTLRNFLKENL